MEIVLASASPRRRELLARAGLRFRIEPSSVPEDLDPGLDPRAAALELAGRKAEAVAARARGARSLVLAADTIVALGEESGSRLLGKPESPEEAHRMLASLSGTRHLVVTGLCVIRTPDGARSSASERTWVRMRPILPEEIAAYVASEEWRDKAGGYAIQENADRFVLGLEEGGFDNVVGLPVRLALALLRSLGAEGLPPVG